MAFETGAEEVGLVCFRGSATVSVAGQTLHAGPLRRRSTSRATRTVSVATDDRGRPRRVAGAGRAPLPAAVRPVRGRRGQSRAALQGGRPRLLAHAEHAARQERPGRPAHGGRHVVRSRQLDQLAAARARGSRRGAVRLLRHAARGLRHPDGLHRQDWSRSASRWCATATS